ncbi:MAG: DUF5050 domain-containing protein [bacterium]
MNKVPAGIVLLIVLLLAFPVSAGEKLYFADNGNDKILRCDLNGTNLEELVTTDIEVVGCIDIDRTGGKMYWTDWASATAHIKRADLDGANIETLLSSLSGPYGLALDVTGGKMYWTEFSINVIRRANLDGTGMEDLVTSGLSHPAGIALDLTAGKIYWADGATEYSAKIQRANLDGTSVETLVDDPLIAPQVIKLDLTAGKMYWSDLGTDSWWRANLDGTDLEEILFSVYGTPIGVALDLSVNKLYVSEYGGANSEIKRCNLDGTGVEVILSSGVGAIYGLTLGPATAECSNASMSSVWMAIVTGVEVYDYAVWMHFDGLGTIIDMGAYSVPDPAGTYAIEADCDLTGTIWSDGYVPFTGHVYSETLADMDIGFGPIQVLKVTDLGALEECWSGHFIQDTTGTVWDVTLTLDAYGMIASATGFPGIVDGRIYTEQDHVAGHFELIGPGPPAEIMLLDAAMYGNSVMSGTYGMDCIDYCPGGSFYLHWCSLSSVEDGTPQHASVSLRNFPNPFNPRTTVGFTLAVAGHTRVQVVDLSGRTVATLLDSGLSVGRHTVEWDGRDAAGRATPSGVYFMCVETEQARESVKMVLLK